MKPIEKDYPTQSNINFVRHPKLPSMKKITYEHKPIFSMNHLSTYNVFILLVYLFEAKKYSIRKLQKYRIL